MLEHNYGPFGLNVLLDLCGGTEQAVQTLLPHHVAREAGAWGSAGLWLDRQASDALALRSDESDAQCASPDLDALAARQKQAEDGGWHWQPIADSGQPALPVPFTAFQLAAFMLAGGGMELHDKFDFRPLLLYRSDPQRAAEVERDAFDGALESLGPNANEARHVIRLAMRLRAETDTQFGRDDADVVDARDWLLSGDAEQWLRAGGKAAGVAQELDESLLATKEQLVGAFGAATGMKDAWFNSLKDRPALSAACKRKGRGARGSRQPPLFCPFEVMQWLTGNGKAHRQLSESMAWRLLERHFSRVHRQHSAADPRDK